MTDGVGGYGGKGDMDHRYRAYLGHEYSKKEMQQMDAAYWDGYFAAMYMLDRVIYKFKLGEDQKKALEYYLTSEMEDAKKNGVCEVTEL